MYCCFQSWMVTFSVCLIKNLGFHSSTKILIMWILNYFWSGMCCRFNAYQLTWLFVNLFFSGKVVSMEAKTYALPMWFLIPLLFKSTPWWLFFMTFQSYLLYTRKIFIPKDFCSPFSRTFLCTTNARMFWKHSFALRNLLLTSIYCCYGWIEIVVSILTKK